MIALPPPDEDPLLVIHEACKGVAKAIGALAVALLLLFAITWLFS